MPLYEYKCQKCGTQFEVMQKFSDTPLTTHEGCGGDVEKIISAPALQFKGSGWYITDYAKGNNSSPSGKSAEGKSGDAAAKTESKSDTKSDSGSTKDSSASSPSTPSSSSSSEKK